MKLPIPRTIAGKLMDWFLKERPQRRQQPLTDFERLSFEIRPGDILLIEGRNRVSEVIRLVTQSPWTHAALYIGRLHDIENPILREKVSQIIGNKPEEQLLIESILGQGTIVSSITTYHREHIRICRPHGIGRRDTQEVIAYALGHIGVEYDVRRIFDLLRFLYPWSFLPRRWRSSLFNFKPGKTTKEICSSLLAAAFAAVKFPILPHIKETKIHPKTGKKKYQLIRRNPYLFTPSDFDYSPYFDIIKYPMFEIEDRAAYRNLPWNEEGLMSNDGDEIVDTSDDKKKPADK